MKYINSFLLSYLFIICLVLCLPLNVHAKDYLTGTETIAISAASVGIGFLGIKAKKISEGRRPLITGNLPYEDNFQRWLGGDCKIGKSNFLDDKRGSAFTPLVSGILLTSANLTYPRNNKNKDATQDLFLFLGGVIATKGVTDIAKGIFARERPFYCLLDENTTANSTHDRSYLQHSFFSGHTSSAFFSSAYLNLRIRSIMRQRMTGVDYNNWKWASSGVLFSWASIVGLSRVHAYKHHLSDVIVGAVAGILLAELFYSFNTTFDDSTDHETSMQFKLTFSF